MKGITNFSFLFLIVQSASLLHVSAARLQQLVLYTEPNCRGQTETFYENEPNIQQDFHIIGRNAKSVGTDAGTWVVAGVINGETTFNGWMTGNIGMLCTTWHVSNQTAIYTSIRRVAGSELDTPSISFYNEPDFQGKEIYIDDTMDFTLQNFTMNVQSIAMTGTRSWGVFPMNDLMGFPDCILSQDYSGFPADVSMYTLVDINAGSAKIDCRRNSANYLSKNSMTHITVEKRLNINQKQNLNNNYDVEFTSKIASQVVSKMQLISTNPSNLNSITFNAESLS